MNVTKVETKIIASNIKKIEIEPGSRGRTLSVLGLELIRLYAYRIPNKLAKASPLPAKRVMWA